MGEKEPHIYDIRRIASGGELFNEHDYMKYYPVSMNGGACAAGKEGVGNFFMDATPKYIRTWAVPERMAEFIPAKLQPDLRMVTILREPLSRDLSWYNHMLGNQLGGRSGFKGGDRDMRFGNTSAVKDPWCKAHYYGLASSTTEAPTYTEHAGCMLDVWEQCTARTGKGAGPQAVYKECSIRDHDQEGESSLTYLMTGMYLAQLRRFLIPFKRSQLLVVSMEQLLRDPSYQLEAVYGFLGLDRKAAPGALPHDSAWEHNPWKVEAIECATKERLVSLFAPWNDALYDELAADHEHGRAPLQERFFHKWGADMLPACTTTPLRRPAVAAGAGKPHDDGDAGQPHAMGVLMPSPMP